MPKKSTKVTKDQLVGKKVASAQKKKSKKKGRSSQEEVTEVEEIRNQKNGVKSITHSDIVELKELLSNFECKIFILFPYFPLNPLIMLCE